MTELARCESGQSCVLFDLDGTLIDHDSTSGFLRQRLCGHPFRLLAACLVLPLLGPLMVAGLFKTGVASTLMWIATVGLDRAGLDAAVRDYLAGARHKAGSYPRACAELRRWQRRGVAAIVVTASAQILAEPLCEDLGLDVQVIGSTLTRRAG
ncbi:haloacid dehalogenase-like hydrolase, partial [Mesomycoplasma ovipneumoniae]|uniref:haloacid dehalogenase-like hydrolase n=1 Tax=Mesomycoplasma ovipneumoniae TaxID=29562 RepID=UPI003CC7F9E5